MEATKAAAETDRQPTEDEAIVVQNDAIVVQTGEGCHAHGEGMNITVIAAGDKSRASAVIAEGSHMACVVATGTGCVAEIERGSTGCIAVAALGIGSTSISNLPEIESVAIGYDPFAQAIGNGTAISIGQCPSAQTGEGGFLVFIDTSGFKPEAAIFAVDPDQGIWPDVPYQWESGWKTPCPDWERMDREGFERGIKFAQQDAKATPLAVAS